MKKKSPPYVCHKRTGKVLSSGILQAKQSPKGEEKDMSTRNETSAEHFLGKLRAQIRKTAFVWMWIVLGSFSLMLFSGCLQKKKIMPPLGKWKRDAVYLNGDFNHERKATLTLKKTTFKYEESSCEMKGSVAYQSQAMIFGIEQSDCQGFAARQTVYYGQEIDPADGRLKIFHNNQFNDTILEVYQKAD